MKHPDLFPKQSGLLGEEFDKNNNPRCSPPTIFLFLEIWAMEACLASRLQKVNDAKSSADEGERNILTSY